MRVLQNKVNGNLVILKKINLTKGTYELQSGSVTMKFRVFPWVNLLDNIRRSYEDLGAL